MSGWAPFSSSSMLHVSAMGEEQAAVAMDTLLKQLQVLRVGTQWLWVAVAAMQETRWQWWSWLGLAVPAPLGRQQSTRFFSNELPCRNSEEGQKRRGQRSRTSGEEGQDDSPSEHLNSPRNQKIRWPWLSCS